jgi:hypothetical protein
VAWDVFIIGFARRTCTSNGSWYVHPGFNRSWTNFSECFPDNVYVLESLSVRHTYFVRHHSDSPYKYSEANIKSMLGFLVDNIYVVFGDQVFQQSVGIPMDTNCAPLLADL